MTKQDEARPDHADGRSPRYLLVSRIGRKSLHQRWLQGPRAFDVFLSAYDTALPPVSGSGVRFEHRPGYKVAGYDGFLREHRDLWRRYDYICLFDEDLDADTETLNRMFALCEKYRLKIAQPALTWDSHFTYAGLLRQPAFVLRHVNYIEMMCPVFRKDALEAIAPLYGLGYESGIDLIWCNLVYEQPTDFAVLDSTPVRHTEPVGNNKAANGFIAGRLYEDDISAVLTRFGLPWLSCTPYIGISPSGDQTHSRLAFLRAALPLAIVPPRHPPLAKRVRMVLDHLRHIIFRPARNIRVDMPLSSQTEERSAPPSSSSDL